MYVCGKQSDKGVKSKVESPLPWTKKFWGQGITMGASVSALRNTVGHFHLDHQVKGLASLAHSVEGEEHFKDKKIKTYLMAWNDLGNSEKSGL